jgi:hypothetical protein
VSLAPPSTAPSNATRQPPDRETANAVPQKHQCGAPPVQRPQHRHAGRKPLDTDREHRLQDGRGWTWNPHADRWDEGLARLLDYVRRNGDARVPRSYTVDGYKLGAWVKKQRVKHADGTLVADRERRLQEVPGWTWDPFADMWEEGFQSPAAVRRTTR